MNPELASGAHSLIFWYTGVIVWFAIGLMLAAACLIASVFAVAQSYHRASKWQWIWGAVYMNQKERSHFFTACRWGNLTPEEWKKLLRIISRHRKFLKNECRAANPIKIRLGAWYELNDGTVGQVVSSGGSDFNDRVVQFRLLGADWRMNLRGDGVCPQNPKIRAIHEVEEPQASGLEGEPLHPLKAVVRKRDEDEDDE